MEEHLYSALGLKRRDKGNFFHGGKKTSLSRLHVNKQTDISESDFLNAFLEDLKIVLTKNDLKELIDKILQIEANLLHYEEMDIPIFSEVLKDFHNILSPILLRIISANLNTNKSLEDLDLELKEALRVSIEEEIYIWQEKRF
jgi:hypothetical protein